MAIKALYEVHGRKYTDAHRSGRAELSYLVLTDVRNTQELNVANYAGVPRKGDEHPRIFGLYATNIDIYNDEDAPQLWHVDVTYETPGGSEYQQELNEPNPLSRAPRYTWFTQIIQRAAERTVVQAGDPEQVTIPGLGIGGAPVNLYLTTGIVRNSANCLLDPPLMMDETILCLRVTKNEESWNPSIAYQYGGAMNSDAFYLDVAPYQAKMDHITASGPLMDNGVEYWEVEYELHFREDTWFDIILDKGKLERVPKAGGIGSPPPMEFHPWELADATGKALGGAYGNEEGPLNGSGAFRKDFDPSDPWMAPVYRCFKLRKLKAFGPLKLFEIPLPSGG